MVYLVGTPPSYSWGDDPISCSYCLGDLDFGNELFTIKEAKVSASQAWMDQTQRGLCEAEC
jgi:hypothetical protein